MSEKIKCDIESCYKIATHFPNGLNGLTDYKGFCIEHYTDEYGIDRTDFGFYENGRLISDSELNRVPIAEQIKTLKLDMEKSVASVVNEFEKTTGLFIDSIQIIPDDWIKNNDLVYDCKIEVSLTL